MTGRGYKLLPSILKPFLFKIIYTPVSYTSRIFAFQNVNAVVQATYLSPQITPLFNLGPFDLTLRNACTRLQ